MRERPEQFRGKKGRSGRQTLKKEMAFFTMLDNALPKVVSYCYKLIEKAERLDEVDISEKNELEQKLHKADVKDYHSLALKASQTLMSKAPQRIQGSEDDGAILIKSIKLDV